MLKPAEAQERLKRFQDAAWPQARLAVLAKLPQGPREIGRGLLGQDASGKPLEGWQALRAASAAAGKRLLALPAKERRLLFESLFPKIARYVEGAWERVARLPYRTGMTRMAFRAPNDAAASGVARANWAVQLLETLRGYDQDIRWLAAWAGHLRHYGNSSVGLLLGAALDAGGQESDEVFDILCDTARGEHEIGLMGRHVTRALLVASRPEGWEFVEKLLIAAQRQEGLRQVILETVDEAHPEAFRRMLRLIREHDLGRFSATVRAVNVWFGYGWDSVSVNVVNKAIERILCFLEDDAARAEALNSDDGETVYQALWATAFEDAPCAVEPAARLLKDADVARRFVGTTFLADLQLSESLARLPPVMDDEDLRVAMRAFNAVARRQPEDDPGPKKSDLFERFERLLQRLPAEERKLEPLVWPWIHLTAGKEQAAAALLTHLGDRSPTQLIPYLSLLNPYGRRSLVAKLAEQKKWDAATRETLFALVGDKNAGTREAALKALAKCSLSEDESRRMEALLTRKTNDLRRAVLTLLLSQKDAQAFASADRLLAASDALQRLAGLELLRLLSESGRNPDGCRERAEAFQARRSRINKDEQVQINVLLESGRQPAALDDALGLMNPAERTKPTPPKKCKVVFATTAALECLKALDEWIAENRETPVVYETCQGAKEELLGNIQWGFPAPQMDKPLEEDVARLPLREVWQSWLENRPRKQRDDDGLELVRALTWHAAFTGDVEEMGKRHPEWANALKALTGGFKSFPLKYARLVRGVLEWLLRMQPPKGLVDFLLNAIETSLALVPPASLARVVDPGDWQKRDLDWRSNGLFTVWIATLERCHALCKPQWTKEQDVRYWRLLAWRDEPGTAVPRKRPDFTPLLDAYLAGGATEADLFDHLLGPRGQGNYRHEDFDSLKLLTKRGEVEEFKRSPHLKELVDRCRARILEVELERGETPTAASQPAMAIRSLVGVDLLLRFLAALGDKPFTRGYYFNKGLGKADVLTHLIEATYPAETDTVQSFADRVKEAGVTTERLLALAFTATQWAPHVEQALDWANLGEGVWWFFAHTRGAESGLDRDAWKALISERTALTLEELQEGAVDVAWFHRVHSSLGPRRWQPLREAAKYAAAAQGHKRALLLSDVMLGKAKKTELVRAVKQKRAREAVRSLGLLPLAKGAGLERDLLDRYKVFQEYLRYARQLGAMSKESALRSAAIGMQNLARTAGYPDPIRLEWAMEARAIADLAQGPVQVTADGVTVTLSLVGEGEPELSIVKQGKALKAIPSAIKKNAKVADLVQRKADLKKQASRMRLSLETAMCRGDAFLGTELRRLFEHPVLAPQLQRLVLIGEGILGYPVSGGKGLRDHAGKVEPIKEKETLRIAHPHDLLATGQWHEWQHDLFAREAVQPFKQVFRELYVLTEQEKAEGTLSRRYAGHQINPSQATALWGSRGWSVSHDEGVRRTFHDEGLSAYVGFLNGVFTPAEVEGLTLETVFFCKRGEWKPLPLTQVPARVFSESMRDLDLVVSVAHRGGVDPEASASSVEMRASLLRETCQLLKIDNVRIKNAHVLIDGALSQYSVHLGSAVVHRQPGGSLCLMPVHAQHRGRLFLPFADDDPKTAEVLSKVILLARDREIQDPGILEQLRA